MPSMFQDNMDFAKWVDNSTDHSCILLTTADCDFLWEQSPKFVVDHTVIYMPYSCPSGMEKYQ